MQNLPMLCGRGPSVGFVVTVNNAIQVLCCEKIRENYFVVLAFDPLVRHSALHVQLTGMCCAIFYIYIYTYFLLSN